jgi:hypothetical protein
MKKGFKVPLLRKIKMTSPFHPFLFALFPALFLYAHNISELLLNSIFNLFFKTDFELLEDKAYVFENAQHPYKLFDVTNKLNGGT